MPPMSTKKNEVGSLGVQSAARASSPPKPSVSMGSLGLKSANAGNKRPFTMMSPTPATPTFNSYSPASIPYSSTPSFPSQLQFQMELQRALAVMQMQSRQPLFSGSHVQLPQNMYQRNTPSSQALTSLLQQGNMSVNANALRPPQPPTTGRFVDVSALNRDSKRRKVVKQPVQKNTTSSSSNKKPSAEEATASKNARRAKKTMGRWTDEEHTRFLDGLEAYGSHDWRGVAGVVKTRTIVQVRTHAQKYFQKVGKAVSQSCAGSVSGSVCGSDDEASVRSSSERGSSGISTPREAVVYPYVNGMLSPCMSPSLIPVESVEYKLRPTPSFSFNNNNNNLKSMMNKNNNKNNNVVHMNAPVATSALARLASIALSGFAGV